ncbi:MAG: phospholipase D-like domain-containing protein, partial [Phycisphaerae bacterium]|nr:phospholipase D-like domain-containing protein [Phycisphaerae bacterium]
MSHLRADIPGNLHNVGLNLHPGPEDDGWRNPPPVVLADGTIAQLLKDGEALREAYQAIANAQRMVCLEVYIFGSDETGRAFADLLCRCAQDGVRVYVSCDSFGCLWTDRAIFRQMREAGVRVEEFHPMRPWECRYSWRPANRDHRKLLVVDEQVAWLGGMNIGDEYAGPWVV